MNIIQLAVALSGMLKAGKTVFVGLQPEVADYTSGKFPTLVVRGADRDVTVPLDPGNIKQIVGILQGSILAEGVTVVGWNVKNLISNISFVTRKPFKPDCQVFDLKLLEAYLGRREQPPASWVEAMRRLKAVVTDRSWERLQKVHQEIHLPLALDVIPSVETYGWLDEKTRRYVYPYYEIEGQKNGRLKCLEPFEDVYNPHVIKPEDKERLLPRHRDEVFMYLDFHNMELAMVQWLSGDEKLKEMMAAGDVYGNIYKAIKGTADRIAGKNLFLPVIYGESPESLSREWEISYEDALYHVRSLEQLFPTAFRWVGRACENGEAEDHFGRRRKFEENETYKVRNFYVQSPGSLVCLEKLIRLHSVLSGVARVACHVHDGYIVAAKKDTWREAFRLSVDALEGPSEWCPGLKLTVGCQAGRKLHEMSVLRKVTKG